MKIQPPLSRLLSLGLIFCWLHTTKAQPAAEQITETEKLAASVTIIRDNFGVPHIYAPTDSGVVFGAAWAQAEDNWWQVEDNFIHSLGRASEIYGEESFVSDYLVRALEIRRLSMAEYSHAPEPLRLLSTLTRPFLPVASWIYWIDKIPVDSVRAGFASSVATWFVSAALLIAAHAMNRRFV